MDLLLPATDGKEVASPQLYLPVNRPVKLHGPVQGRAARLLGPGLPHEDRRGAGDRHAPTASRPTARGDLPGRLRRAVRARPLDDAPDRARGAAGRFDAWLARARQAGRGRRRRRRPAAAARAPTARRSSPPTAAAAATRWPTPAPPARSARTSTRSSRARTRPSSSSRSSIPNAKIATGFQSGDHAAELRPDAVAGAARRAGEVPFRSDQGRADDGSTARTRPAPRAALFLVLGVLFCAAIVARRPRRCTAARRSSTAASTTTAQNAILLVSLLVAPLFFLVGLGAFDYWFYWAAGKPTRPEDHSGHGAHSLAATTSGSTPITR